MFRAQHVNTIRFNVHPFKDISAKSFNPQLFFDDYIYSWLSDPNNSIQNKWQSCFFHRRGGFLKRLQTRGNPFRPWRAKANDKRRPPNTPPVVRWTGCSTTWQPDVNTSSSSAGLFAIRRVYFWAFHN